MTTDDEALPHLLRVSTLPTFDERRRALEDLGVIDGEEAAGLLGTPPVVDELRQGRVPPALRSELRQIAVAERQAWLGRPSADEHREGVQSGGGVGA